MASSVGWWCLGGALPLGSAGIRSNPGDEASVVAILQANILEPGFYILPGTTELRHLTKEQRTAAEAEWTEKYRRGPTGSLIYRPAGGEPVSLRQLGTELLSNILGATIAAILLTMAGGGLTSFVARVVFVTLLGLFASIAIDVSHWNWYGFPTTYTVAALADQVLSWFFGGLVLAAIVRARA